MSNYPKMPISGDDQNHEEKAMKWAALRRLPTETQVRTSIFKNIISGDVSQLDFTKLGKDDKILVVDRVDRLVAAFNHDPHLFFTRFRQRFDAVGLEFPTVRVQFEHLKVNAYVHVGSRALPTIPNFIYNMTEAFLRKLGIIRNKDSNLCILDDVSGIVRPSRLTLLLGPPSSGKTTLLMALAGRLCHSLKTSGKISYNGRELHEFIPQKTSAYVSQSDWHMGEMTPRDIIEFSGRCQGVGYKYDLILELLRREKGCQTQPDEDLDILIKAFALGEQKTNLFAEFIIKILGLDICADTPVGDEMRKGISGGEKKRLSIGELLVGTSRVLLMDEISRGLDSSTTHQIITYLKHYTNALEMTTLISLLQPDPETFEQFDDVILLCEGHIVYHGPRQDVLEFFAHMGFKCPDRKNVADFLQEVTSINDQQQYWADSNTGYQYVPVTKFVEAFRSFHVGLRLSQELAIPFTGLPNPSAALSTSANGVKGVELIKIGLSWQILLLKRTAHLSIFKIVQLLLAALFYITVFFRGTMDHKTLEDASVYLGIIYISLNMTVLYCIVEIPLLILKLPALYKHRDFRFYPCWVYSLSAWLLSIPFSLAESLIWVGVTYYAVGFDPDISRCLKQFLLIFITRQAFVALFRVLACVGRNMVLASTFASFGMLFVISFGGFIFSRDNIPKWWLWGYWISPIMYGQNAASVNEFLGHSWDKKIEVNNTLTLGKLLLKSRSLFPQRYWYWIGVAALLGFTVLFNILFTLSLTFLNSLEKRHVIVSVEEHSCKDHEEARGSASIELRQFLQKSFSFTGEELQKTGMVIPFQPVSMAFCNVNYYVNAPKELKQQGVLKDKVQLLVNVTGAFRPGILTALVGVSGAGKTTLMDVLSGRITSGTIEGSIYISGFPKSQDIFARISGYCEQHDNHSPYLTVLESLIFSAWLRLPCDVNQIMRQAFVDEIMELVELTPISGALVGLPGIEGLSTEQRKRLTIAVELVANPSIVFMDEPTTGLDARSAAIVMRTVRKIANTGRTIVCTIHQPSIDIFESFDELLLMKHGGRLIYAGPLGRRSREVIKYFEEVEGVPKLNRDSNPATWILDVSSPIEESRIGIDFAEIYLESSLFQRTKQIVEYLSEPNFESLELSSLTKYSLPFMSQYIACLWKQNLSYWRNPLYTAARFMYAVLIALIFGTLCWKFGSKRDTQQDVFNAIGSMFSAILFIGMTNAFVVQPVIYVERFVSYRERAARMYCPEAFALAQVTIETLHVFILSLIYCSIFYFMASFELNLWKIAWYFYFMFFSLLYFTAFGMMTIGVTPDHIVAAIVSAPFYLLWNVFSGFVIPRMRIPVWWRWCYWANPFAWTLYGLATSQYGDMDDLVKLSDGVRSVPMRQLLEDQYGYRQDFMVVAAIMVACFCVIFIVTFSYAIKAFNFQKR